MSIEEKIFVSSYVREKEALRIGGLPKPDGSTAEDEDILLDPFIEGGLLHTARIESEKEQSMMLELINRDRLDDGEAITIAIALNRGWAIATDEKKAAKRIRDVSKSTQVLTTPEIVMHWYEVFDPPEDELRECIINIRRRACYQVAGSNPLKEWWNDIINL